jgi:hypothetical protein
MTHTNHILDSSTAQGRREIVEILQSGGWRLHKKTIPQMRYNERIQSGCKMVTSSKDNRKVSEIDAKKPTPEHKTRSNS